MRLTVKLKWKPTFKLQKFASLVFYSNNGVDPSLAIGSLNLSWPSYLLCDISLVQLFSALFSEYLKKTILR